MALQTLDLENPGETPEDNDEDFEVVEKNPLTDEEEDHSDPDLNDDDDDFDIEEEDSDDEGDFSDDDDEEEEEEEEDAEEEEETRSKRENDRIRTLVEEKNKARQEALEAERQRVETHNKMIDMQNNTVKTQKQMLENHIKSVKGQLLKAQEDQDAGQIIDLQETLSKAQYEMQALNGWKAPEKLETPKDTQGTNNEGQMQEPPEAFTTWAARNPWFEKPKNSKDLQRRQEAIAYSDMLLQQGLSVETDEFYSLVDERLEQLNLASTPKNKVKSKSNTNKPSSSVNKKRRKKKITQTVQGASRTPMSRKNSKNNKNKVTLTAEQLEIAELYGMTPLEYAKEVKKIEDSKAKGKRMTTINV